MMDEDDGGGWVIFRGYDKNIFCCYCDIFDRNKLGKIRFGLWFYEV